MSKLIGLVGHCGPDAYMLRSAVKYVVKDADVRMINDRAALDQVIGDGVGLLLINRLLDYGFDDVEGVSLIRSLRETHPDLKLMLVTNYEDVQAASVAAGALPGFGKGEIGSARMRDALMAATQ